MCLQLGSELVHTHIGIHIIPSNTCVYSIKIPQKNVPWYNAIVIVADIFTRAIGVRASPKQIT